MAITPSTPPPPADDNVDTSLFDEPEDYYPPTPPPTVSTHTLQSGQVLNLHLVGHSPLEAHHLWNGSRVCSDFFEASPSTTVQNRTVLEIGAGAGLPSITAAILGAKKVVVTDYPDPDLVVNLWKNCEEAGLLPADQKDWEDGKIVADGFVWGADPTPLLKRAPGGFDVLILADLLFRHTEHGNMVKSIRDTLRKGRDAKAYVFFSSYRPWLQHKDLAFFDLVREKGLVVEKILERKMDRPLFENDPGDEEVLKTVTGWVVTWPESEWEA
ncbi:nicotinamide n-methyltransferase [Coniochaeta pulveracea]|uniref:Protein N-terminal and lysine N-methyltransferase EFM7 n=1 Tax=Coniochaeta pulveracea TaxID=177199 RepID=A0A420YLB4_9PEZI|nr:nicotinamide n-methyltransferase [Coniochaeta pulveracea]